MFKQEYLSNFYIIVSTMLTSLLMSLIVHYCKHLKDNSYIYDEYVKNSLISREETESGILVNYVWLWSSVNIPRNG